MQISCLLQIFYQVEVGGQRKLVTRHRYMELALIGKTGPHISGLPGELRKSRIRDFAAQGRPNVGIGSEG